MKTNLCFLFCFLFIGIHPVLSQTIIGTSHDLWATASRNQRKIVRDASENIYVVYTDYEPPLYVIKGVKYDGQAGSWGDPFEITEGYSPTLAIADAPSSDIYLLFHTLDSISKVKYIRSTDFISWSEDILVSDSTQNSLMPVADIDSAGALNVFWKRLNYYEPPSLIYAKVQNDTLLDKKIICTKTTINDYSIANHLQYTGNDLFFGIEYYPDSIAFYWSGDGMQTYQQIYSARGVQPGITCNSYHELEEDCIARLLYLDMDSYLMEVEFYNEWTNPVIAQVPVGHVEYYCVDDLAPPIGYSFIFQQGYGLYHAFSYGSWWDWCSIMDSVFGYDLYYPSVAFKYFNFEYVDYIYLKDDGAEKYIIYKRDEKHIWTSTEEDPEQGKGFSITGGPNPFSDGITLNIELDKPGDIPQIEIYNTGSRLIRKDQALRVTESGFSYVWKGTDLTGNKVDAGLYIFMFSVGDKGTARKIIYNP